MITRRKQRDNRKLVTRSNTGRVVSLGMVLALTLVQLFVPTASAAISFRASANANGNADMAAVTVPSGVLPGDVIVVTVSIRRDTASIDCPVGDSPISSSAYVDPPSGFTSIRQQSSDVFTRSFYRIATASEPASYNAPIYGLCSKAAGGTGTRPASAKYVTTSLAYANVDTTAPINASASQWFTGDVITAPSVNTTVTNTMIVSMFATVGAETISTGLVTQREHIQSSGGSAASKHTLMVGDHVSSFSGASGSKSASSTGFAENVGMTVALTPAIVNNSTVTQGSYRFFENADSVTTGAPLAAINTPASMYEGVPFRLRLLLDVSTENMTNGSRAFTVQRAEKVSTCAAASYTTIGNTSGYIGFNASVADDAAISVGANDPAPSGQGASAVAQTYNENNNLTTSVTVNSGDSGLWDISLQAGLLGDAGKTYCYRIVNLDGSPLNSYNQYPEITITEPPLTAQLIPDGDVTDQWLSSSGTDTSCAGGAKCDLVDEDITLDSNYIHTGTALDTTGESLEFTLSSPNDVGTASQLLIRANLYTASVQSAADTVSINIRVNGALQTAVVTPALGSTSGWYEATFTGPWTQADVNSMQVYLTRTSEGNGPASGRDDDVVLNSVYGTLTYEQGSPSATLNQEAYRFFQNADSATPGAGLATSNTPVSVTAASPFRLRILLGVTGADLGVGASNFILQVGEKLTTCSAASYSAVTSFHDNAGITDNTTITTNANDPQAAVGAETPQTYNEDSAFTSAANTAVGDSALWDFSLSSVSGDAGKTYCYRAVYADGTPLGSYALYPEVTFTSAGPTINQQMRGGQSVVSGTKSPLVW